MTNLRESLLLLFLACFATISALASDFKAGYVISNQMDTLYGEINNRSYRENSLQCQFRKTPADTVQLLNPNDIFGYRFIDEKYYVSKFVPQYKSVLFLEYLVKGSLDVFFIQDNDNVNRFYVAKDTMPLRLLKYELKDIYEEGLHYQQLYNMSNQVLEYYTMDCPEMLPLIRKMKKPEHEQMIRLASEYTRRVCPGGTCEIFEKKMPSKVYVSASSGVGYFSLSKNRILNIYPFNSDGLYFSYSINMLFQQPWVSESTYFGIGLSDENRIPVILLHMPDGKGVKPFIGYEIDLNHLLATQNVMTGFCIPIGSLALKITANLGTELFFTPITTSIQLGLLYQLR